MVDLIEKIRLAHLTAAKVVYNTCLIAGDGQGGFVVYHNGLTMPFQLTLSDNTLPAFEEALNVTFCGKVRDFDLDDFYLRLYLMNIDWQLKWRELGYGRELSGYVIPITPDEQQQLQDGELSINQVLSRVLVLSGDFEEMNWLQVSMLLEQYSKG